MKTQIHSKRNARVSRIGFLLFVATTRLGCWIIYNGVNMLVRSLDTVFLTADGVLTIGVDVVPNHLYDNLYTVLGSQDLAYFKRVGQSC